MRLRPTNLIPLLLPFLLMALPVVILWNWEQWSAEVARATALERWQKELFQRLEQFRGLSSKSSQWRFFLSRAGILINRDLGTTRQQDLSGPLLMKGLKQAIPPSHWLPGVKVFGFSFDGKGRGTPFRDQGFDATKARIIAQLFAELALLDRNKDHRSQALTKRSSQMFGPMISTDLLVFARGRELVRGVFNQQPVELFWHTFSRGKRLIGGVLVVLPAEFDLTPYHRFALTRKIWQGDPECLPVLLPIQSARQSLRPLVPEELRAHPLVQSFLRLAYARDSFDSLVPPGETRPASEPLVLPAEAGAPAPRAVHLFRSPISPDIPYEAWVLKPAIPDPAWSGRFSSWLLGGFLGFWLWLGGRTLTATRPFSMPMRWWFLCYLVLISGVPIVMILVFGHAMIDLQTTGTIDRMERSVRSTFEEIDSNGSGLLNRFGALCTHVLSRPDVRKALIDGPMHAGHPLFPPLFKVFNQARIPLESLIVYRVGAERVFYPRGSEKFLKDAFQGFYLPLLSAAIRYFDPPSWAKAEKALSEIDQKILGVYDLIVKGSMNAEIAFILQKSESFEVAGEEVFQYLDLLADQNRIAVCIVFRGLANSSYFRYARKAIAELPSERNTRKRFLAWRNRNGKVRLVYYGHVSAGERKNLRRFAGQMIFSRASALRDLPGNRTMIGFCGQRAKQLVMGELVDFTPALAEAEHRKQNLKLTTGALLVFILLLGVGFSRWFFQPLARMETALQRILNKDLDVRLGFVRDDELGDVSAAFDRMTTGLKERYELGQFVSGTLDATVAAGESTQTEPQQRHGTVLASDIRSFTTLSEKFPVEQIVSMLNLHLDVMSQEIKARGGMIDEFIGDAIVAVFFDDVPEKSIKRAVEAAQGMMRTHQVISDQRLRSGLFPYGMGVGISHGDILLGTFGSTDRLEFAILGTPRNLAEEMEAASKAGRLTKIILDPETAARCPGIPLSPLPEHHGLEVSRWE